MTDIYTRKRIQDTVEGLGYKYITNDNYELKTGINYSIY